MGIEYTKCERAAGRIYLEASKLLASDGGLRTAEAMLTDILETGHADWPRGYHEAEGEDRAAVITVAFFRRLEIAVKQCGHHLGSHLGLEKLLKTANRSAGVKPLGPEDIPLATDPEALRKRDLDRYRLLNVTEVAYILQWTEGLVRKAVRRRKLKCVELGTGPKHWRFRPADVDRYIAKLAGDERGAWRQW